MATQGPEPSAREVAEFMVTLVPRGVGSLSQSRAAAHVRKQFGDEFVYKNKNRKLGSPGGRARRVQGIDERRPGRFGVGHEFAKLAAEAVDRHARTLSQTPKAWLLSRPPRSALQIVDQDQYIESSNDWTGARAFAVPAPRL